MPQTIDEQYAAIASQAPGFGGMYWDTTTGRLTAHMTDPTVDRIEAARVAIDDHLSPGNASLPDLTFIEGQYDFRDLSSWRTAIKRRAKKLKMSDVDEVANRVLVAVEDDEAKAALVELLGELTIPSEAVIIRTGARAVPNSTIRDAIRPMPGGVQVQVPGVDPCTLGFIAIREYPGQEYDLTGERYLTTASHCTSAFAFNGGDSIGQPTPGTRVASEWSDPPLLSNTTYPSCKDSFANCRLSDIALFRIEGLHWSQSHFGAVAAVDGLQYLGWYYYTGAQAGMGAGMNVTMVGRTTGEAVGTVTHTCVDIEEVPLLDYATLLCQLGATYPAGAGDSGAPVYHTDNLGRKYLLGTHAGTHCMQTPSGQQCFRYLSFWMFSREELGNDILAQTGLQWAPAFTTGPYHYQWWY